MIMFALMNCVRVFLAAFQKLKSRGSFKNFLSKNLVFKKRYFKKIKRVLLHMQLDSKRIHFNSRTCRQDTHGLSLSLTHTHLHGKC
jgi:hypothetical protein